MANQNEDISDLEYRRMKKEINGIIRRMNALKEGQKRIEEQLARMDVMLEDLNEDIEIVQQLIIFIEEYKNNAKEFFENERRLNKEFMIELTMNRDGGQCGSDNRSKTFELFGLSIDFLQQHNIEPPLCERILIENLALNVGTKKIYKVFGMAGKITWMNFRIDKNSKVCVLHYSHPTEAVKAIALLNGRKLYDRNLVVRMDRFKKNEQEFNLSKELTSMGRGLRAHCAPLANVRSVCSAKNEPSAIQKQPRNGEIGQGGQKSDSRIIEVRDLPSNYTWQIVRDRVRQFGDVEWVNMIRPGTARVIFGGFGDAKRARTSLIGTIVEGRVINVEFV